MVRALGVMVNVFDAFQINQLSPVMSLRLTVGGVALDGVPATVLFSNPSMSYTVASAVVFTSLAVINTSAILLFSKVFAVPSYSYDDVVSVTSGLLSRVTTLDAELTSLPMIAIAFMTFCTDVFSFVVYSAELSVGSAPSTV